ncbi:hypothetical protein [Labedella populi]|uniref:hypothetical protein n=1 Tax=Labedella populi TaxID=2498850 RepID=UPI001AA0A5E1|nr:hypothetical protein [Labedella populi]
MTRSIVPRGCSGSWPGRATRTRPAEELHELCAIEPALIGIGDLPVGSDLQLVHDELGIRVVDTATGREVPRESLYVPPQHRSERPESAHGPL